MVESFPLRNFTDFLRIIAKKPAFYLAPGRSGHSDSLRELYSWICGFQMGQQFKQHDPSVLNEFTFWVCHHYSVPDGAQNWYGHILEKSGGDQGAAFKLFFEHFEEYLKDRESVGPEGIKARFVAMLGERYNRQFGS